MCSIKNVYYLFNYETRLATIFILNRIIIYKKLIKKKFWQIKKKTYSSISVRRDNFSKNGADSIKK